MKRRDEASHPAMGKGASDNIGCVGPWGGMECDDGGGKKGKIDDVHGR